MKLKNLFIGITALGLMVLIGTPAPSLSSDLPTSVDGTLIRRGDRDYRIVNPPKSRAIEVYVSKNANPLPSELVVQVKRKNRLLERVKLKLDQRDPEKSRYLGIVPASVSISGGITFDLDN